MTQYEELLDEITNDGIDVIEFDFTEDKLHGLYADNTIAINKNLPTNQKLVTAYEEWGHAKKNCGNILNQSDLNNRKQETLARRWAFEQHMPIDKFIEIIIDCRPTDFWDLVDILDVPSTYLEELIDYYKKRYGVYKEFKEGCIWFDPIEIVLWK